MRFRDREMDETEEEARKLTSHHDHLISKTGKDDSVDEMISERERERSRSSAKEAERTGVETRREERTVRNGSLK